MRNNEIKENIRRNIKEEIAISNIRKEFDMKNQNNRKIIYGILSACAMLVLCIGIAINSNPSFDVADNTENEKNNITIAEVNENIPEDNIIFNNDFLKRLLDIDGKWQDSNITEEFNFFNEIYLPQNFELTREGKIYVKEDINSDDYSHLRQYSLIYSTKTDNATIEIIFSKENTILGCMLPEESKMPSSIINGKELKLFKSNNPEDKNKITAEAFWEKDGYTFYIYAYKIIEKEFINVLKSII